MTRGTKKFLKDLNGLFHSNSTKTCKEVWDILTALRGPDDSNSDVKSVTTEVIRHKIFGLDSKVENHANVSHDTPWKANERKKLQYCHFEKHAQRAFEALGLYWGRENK